MNKLSQSLEDYLETIYTQTTTKGCAKVTDIANALNVKKASVTGALNVLCEKGLINYAPYSAITLTNEGKTEAEKILLKHKVMTNFFKNVRTNVYKSPKICYNTIESRRARRDKPQKKESYYEKAQAAGTTRSGLRSGIDQRERICPQRARY